MHVEEVEDLGIQDLIKGDPNRSPGLHVSSLIKAMCREHEPERFRDGPMDPEKIGAGLAFEDLIAKQMATYLPGDKPGEFEHDGVAGSPDWFNVDPEARILRPSVEEMKCTWMSSRKGITDPKFYHWWVQMRAYCYMAEQMFRVPVRVAKLRALFINDDYERPLSPRIRTYRAEFTERETRENWQMLMNYRGRV